MFLIVFVVAGKLMRSLWRKWKIEKADGIVLFPEGSTTFHAAGREVTMRSTRWYGSVVWSGVEWSGVVHAPHKLGGEGWGCKIFSPWKILVQRQGRTVERVTVTVER